MAESTAVRQSGRQTRAAAPAFDNSYAHLPDRFFTRSGANTVSAPKLIRINWPLAAELGIDAGWLESREGIAMLAGNGFPAAAEPIALAYAGHQFGNFVPQLGDGRALLVGEIIDTSGKRRDLQLKGSGRTLFSRGGDGRAAVGPVMREYVVSEAMAALGIPTTRTLAAVLTGDTVYRETPLPGAVLTRVAASHIRIGTFQYFAVRQDVEAIRLLADHAIGRHFPDLAKRDQPYLALLEQVIAVQADLVARWMLVGFIHGVMNTDNMTISGETIDYGPCAFMDEYDPAKVFSSIDRQGRYAYANQPGIAVWNLARFAESLLPIIHEDQDEAVRLAEEALKTFQAAYDVAFHRGWRRKLGLFAEQEGDLQLIGDLLKAMAGNRADFTLTFRRLAAEIEGPAGDSGVGRLFADPKEFDEWAVRWRRRLAEESKLPAERRQVMLSTNPKYIPRNHRIEAVIKAAVEDADFRPFEELLDVVVRPFDEQPERSDYALPPREDERVLQTFCGT
ncbi:protein adenylyltransferase SelO [Mesorhizobium xinjiangense]|uniref:protein adenylyltransferase SelO n=1 Tax=Mesorhizobium xinjiangense TaxID=2678685 RepID=UPI0012EE4641|nr:YdiU family protein [Mesorhizobium xinjiangense]